MEVADIVIKFIVGNTTLIKQDARGCIYTIKSNNWYAYVQCIQVLELKHIHMHRICVLCFPYRERCNCVWRKVGIEQRLNAISI